jgi:hypothetical protein
MSLLPLRRLRWLRRLLRDVGPLPLVLSHGAFAEY